MLGIERVIAAAEASLSRLTTNTPRAPQLSAGCLTNRASAAGDGPPATQHLPYLNCTHQPLNRQSRKRPPAAGAG